ncbi:hydrogenase maturation protease [Demequina iriomotensis]|uniref:hydrogenase maturation protease n=1 Tax=Demequina iriomotensis TaxID=1536641 RepID=UPI00078367B6|nr:hydrogenase maturation protease [Demequina iriomotensis]
MTAGRVLVVGLGSPDRGDDAVGPAVAERLAALGMDGVDVVTREDPTQLVQLWAGHGAALVVDAVASGRSPGTLHIREVGDAGEPLPTHAFTAAGRGGSHAFGLAGAVELARTLGTLPAHVTVVGVEARTFDFGPMSPEIQEALDGAVATASAELIALTEEMQSCA